AVQLHAAPAHVARLEREIEVRREVEVVRDRDVEARPVPLGEVRREKTAFPPIVDREREVRRVQDRHALELELHRSRGAEALLEVELDLGPLELPGAIALRAGGKEERRQRQPALAAADQDVVARSAGGLGRNLEAG